MRQFSRAAAEGEVFEPAVGAGDGVEVGFGVMLIGGGTGGEGVGW